MKGLRKELCASVCFVLIFLMGFCKVILDDLLLGLVGARDHGNRWFGCRRQRCVGKWRELQQWCGEQERECKGSQVEESDKCEEVPTTWDEGKHSNKAVGGRKTCWPQGVPSSRDRGSWEAEAERGKDCSCIGCKRIKEEQGDVGGEHQLEEGTVAMGGELKKMKPKKSNKPKVVVADVVAAIDPFDLSTFLADITIRIWCFQLTLHIVYVCSS